jgi:hypothetical protein
MLGLAKTNEGNVTAKTINAVAITEMPRFLLFTIFPEEDVIFRI